MSDQELELSGPTGDGFYTSNVMDWVPLCPQLGDSAVRLYWILRSLVIEKHGPVRKLTVMELCYLLPAKPAAPGEPVKPSSVGRIRTLLRALTAVGLVTTPEGKRLTTSSRAKAIAAGPLRIRINDRPSLDYVGPRNAFAVLDAVREEAQLAAEKAAAAEAEREALRKAEKEAAAALTDAGQISDPRPVGQISDPLGQTSDPLGQTSDPHSGADLQDRDPSFSPFSQSSLSPPAPPSPPSPAASDADGTGEREAAAPKGNAPVPDVPQPREETPGESGAERVVEAYVAACAAAGVVAFRKVKERLLEQARELLAEGCPVDWLVARAAEMPANRWTDLAVHAARSKVPMTSKAPRRKASPDCPTCHGSGQAEDPHTFLPTGPCPCLSNDVPATAGR